MRARVTQLPGLEVVRVLRPRRSVSALSTIPDEATEVYVARIEPDRAELIREMIPPQLIIEEDAAARTRRPDRPRVSQPGTARRVELHGNRRDPPDAVPGDRRRRQAPGQCRGEPHRRGIPAGGANGQEGRGHHASHRLAGQARPLLLCQLAEQLLESLSHRAGAAGWRGERRPAACIDETIARFPAHYRYGCGQLQMGLHRVSETLGGKGVHVSGRTGAPARSSLRRRATAADRTVPRHLPGRMRA